MLVLYEIVMKSSSFIRIVLKSFDSQVLDNAVKSVIGIAKQERVRWAGVIPLPTKRTVWTVNRGPHIDKKSMDQYERRIHKRLLCVDATSSFIDAIGRYSLSAGVEAKILLNPKRGNLDQKKEDGK
jgi:small subunit ribosomal protein S10